MAVHVSIGLVVAGIIGLFVLIRVVRTALVLVGNIVAGAVALVVAGMAGIQVPITILTALTVVITGLPGAAILIGLTVYDPRLVVDLTDQFLRLIGEF